jgi:hypothetical protein
MLDIFVFVVPRPDTVPHDSKTCVVAALPFDHVIAERASFAQHRQIAQIPNLMLAVVPAAIMPDITNECAKKTNSI